MKKEASKYCSCLYFSANALSRALTRMAEDEFAITGLAPSYAFLLLSVNGKPGILPGELSVHMQLTPSTVTRLLDKLESKGFITRNSIGRATEIHPTEKSLDINDKIKEAWKNLYKRYTAILGEEYATNLTNEIHISSLKLEEE